MIPEFPWLLFCLYVEFMVPPWYPLDFGFSYYATYSNLTTCFFILKNMALDGIRMPDGCYADGTWELKMHVTDLNKDVSLRVTGEIHIGGVMLKLVEKLGKYSELLVQDNIRLVSLLIIGYCRALAHGYSP